ncbi:glycosyltransferase family 1 protein [Rhizobium leguminosarum]|uniref:glycosyltransferase family 1 protein n=1 Tax=Rhizobium leguminosarum TaxID=384 RepID=UPI001C91E043|nr:glycosyltransferase family 1 protein [Rhizobium leguminosarum]MBY2983091.1 glycosyltransferase family 1 protein [Rhizobium leguminosarum]
MTINQPISSLPAGLPDLALLTEKAAGTGSVIIYQPYLDPSQRSQLDAAAMPLDISFNTQATTREYELFLTLHAHHEAIGLSEDVFWGLLSSKFEMKSVTSFPSFVTEAEKARAEGADAYLYNPLIGHAAIYSNVWEHSLLGGHPGMDPIFLHIQELGYPIAPPQDKTAFAFCNYFCGNRKFWSGYFAFCERILGSLENEARLGTPAGTAYAGSAQYSRDANATMRPFVIERLLGLYVQQAAAKGLKIAAFVPAPAHFEWKFGVRLGRMLHGLFAAKEAFLQSRDQAHLTSWQEGRQPLIKQPHLIWGADDPPGWMPRGQFIGGRELMRAYAPQASGASPVPQQPMRTERPAISAAPKIEQPLRNQLQPFAGGWQAHRDRHCIWIVTPDNYNHSHAFDEVALGLQGAFEELGGSAPITRDMNAFAGRAPIIYGGNLLPAEIVSHLPKDSVVINLEQVSEESIWINSRYTSILKSLPVLDYSPRNRENLAAKGIDHAGVLEIGYSGCLSQIQHAAVKDIDVLFYGSMNERRHHILKTLKDGGLEVAHLFNIYGAERDAAIARAKIVINIHHYASGVFEIVRISYLLANRVCVLTEGDIRDPDLQPFIGGLAIEPYDDMIERCYKLIADADERDAIAAAGLAAMRSRSQSDMLMSVMRAGA